MFACVCFISMAHLISFANSLLTFSLVAFDASPADLPFHSGETIVNPDVDVAYR